MDSDLPTIDAIFVVRFDTKKGNVLEWSNCIPGIELRGVEFSALPSGLHDSSQDVIYFQLEGCIGVSVFANVPSSNVEHRGAQMVSVGVLVKPSTETGRCGQVWRHVDFLKNQAKYHADQESEIADLAKYFTQHKSTVHTAGPSSSSSKRDAYRARNVRRVSRSFTLSEPIQPVTSSSYWQQDILDTDDIPLSHPSRHFLQLVQTMGPTIFILWKAALLKKRILIYTQPPVESACLSVYNICLLATMASRTNSIPLSKVNERILPLFCVGIHDIDHLASIRGGYVACTTDKLFLFKPQLYDVIVDFSAPIASSAQLTDKSNYPRISLVREDDKTHITEEWRCNTEDNRRYFSLMQQLSRSRRRHEWMRMANSGESAGLETANEDTESMSVSSQIHTLGSDGFISSGFNMSDTLRKMLTGGWWWWYGGDDSDDEVYESFRPDATPQSPGLESFPVNDEERPLSGSRLQIIPTRSSNPDTEAIRFFHNITSTLLSRLAHLVALKDTEAIFSSEESTGPTELDRDSRPLKIRNREIQDLGLDSHKDAEFVKEMVQLYFGFTVQLQGSELGIWCHKLCGCCV